MLIASPLLFMTIGYFFWCPLGMMSEQHSVLGTINGSNTGYRCLYILAEISLCVCALNCHYNFIITIQELFLGVSITTKKVSTTVTDINATPTMSGVNCSVLQGKNKLLVDDTKMKKKKRGTIFSCCLFVSSCGPVHTLWPKPLKHTPCCNHNLYAGTSGSLSRI